MTCIPHLSLTPNTFTRDYLSQNAPVVLTGLTEDWECRKLWLNTPCKTNTPTPTIQLDYDSALLPRTFSSIKELLTHISSIVNNPPVPLDPLSTPNFLYLQTLAPEAQISVHTLTGCTTQTLSSFLTSWSQLEKNNDEHVEQSEDNINHSRDIYAKDIHLSLLRSDLNYYSVPPHFAEDWLNEYYVNKIKTDDYRFVYASPASNYTPLHRDVFRSYSWSANICGRKLWILIHPRGQLHLTHNNQELKNLLDFNSHSPFPLFSALPLSTIHLTIQKEGEIIFVPSGWFHQVFNLDDCISINHNWVNGWSIQTMFKYLLEEEKSVISVLKEYSTLSINVMSNNSSQLSITDEDNRNNIEILMKSNSGMNWKDFLSFLQYIRPSQQQKLQNNIQLLNDFIINESEKEEDINRRNNVIVKSNERREEGGEDVDELIKKAYKELEYYEEERMNSILIDRGNGPEGLLLTAETEQEETKSINEGDNYKEDDEKLSYLECLIHYHRLNLTSIHHILALVKQKINV